MTRKRFIELMMSRGYSRNEALDKAGDVARYGSYEVMYQFLKGFPFVMWSILHCFTVIARAASLAFRRAQRQMGVARHG